MVFAKGKDSLSSRFTLFAMGLFASLLFFAFGSVLAEEVTWYAPGISITQEGDTEVDPDSFSELSNSLTFIDGPIQIDSLGIPDRYAYRISDPGIVAHYSKLQYSVLSDNETTIYYTLHENTESGWVPVERITVGGKSVCAGRIGVNSGAKNIFLASSVTTTSIGGSAICDDLVSPSTRVYIQRGADGVLGNFSSSNTAATHINMKASPTLANAYIPLAWVDENTIAVWGGGTRGVLSSTRLTEDQKAELKEFYTWIDSNNQVVSPDGYTIFTNETCIKNINWFKGTSAENDSTLEQLARFSGDGFAAIAVRPDNAASAIVLDKTNEKFELKTNWNDSGLECLWGERDTVPHDGNVLSIGYTQNIDPSTRENLGVDRNLPAGTATDPNASCENKGGSLSWMLCPILNGLDSATGYMYKVVQGELSIFQQAGSSQIIDYDDSIKPMWEGFRNIARGLLVIAFMVIIYVQLMGSTVLDAYNLRKMLPKFVIAVIGVELSWLVFKEFAILVEDVSRGIPDLVLSLFGNGDVPSLSLQISDATAAAAFSAGGVGLWVIIGIGAPALIFGLVPIALSVFLGILIAFFILVLRRMIIVALLVISPIALVLWVIPGTSSLFGKWWQTYQNLLFMYPLIQLLIIAGVILSQIGGEQALTDTNDISQTIRILAGVIAFFAPYFLIPYTFKAAGGAFAGIAGMVNDKGRGIMDRTRNWAKENAAFSAQKAQADLGNRPETRLRRWRAGLSPRRSKEGTLGHAKEMQSRAGATKTFSEIDAFRYGQEAPRIAAMYDNSGVAARERMAQQYGIAPTENGSEFVGSLMQHRLSSADTTLTEQAAAMGYLANQQPGGIDIIRSHQNRVFDMNEGAAKAQEVQRFSLALAPHAAEINGKAKDITTLDWASGGAGGVGSATARTASLAKWMEEEEQKWASADKSTHKELAQRVEGSHDSGEALPGRLVQEYAKALLSQFESGANIKKPIVKLHVDAMRHRLERTPGAVQQETVDRINEALRERGYTDPSQLIVIPPP